MRSLRIFGVTALACATVFGALLACNAIVGVEDVKLKRDRDALVDPEDANGPGGGEGGPSRPNVFQAALGGLYSCARKPEGTVKCWGEDGQGQTGAGEPSDAGAVVLPRDVGKAANMVIDDAIDLAAGRNHACVVRKAGSVACWGFNLYGQLGNAETGNKHTTPVPVMSLTNAAVLAAGDNFSCAIRASGAVACWGGNGSGQLGTGDQSDSPTPVTVRGVSGVVAIAAGAAHACVVNGDGNVLCWGDGQNGQLGGGAPTSSTSPVTVGNLPPATAVSAGERSTCALTRTGSVFCWGANELGQLGNGTTNINANPAPLQVANLEGVTKLASGRNHSCAIRQASDVVCWGAGGRGQLGDGQARPDGGGAQSSLVVVTNVQSALTVGAGGEHSCATTKENGVVCWGANDRGQLGNGSTKSEAVPVPVTGYP